MATSNDAKTLYVIVCEEEVKMEHDLGIALSVRAYREIQKIKETYQWLPVGDNPQAIPEGLPSPQAAELNMKLYVCGSSLGMCVPQTVILLEKAGFHPTIDRAASIW